MGHHGSEGPSEEMLGAMRQAQEQDKGESAIQKLEKMVKAESPQFGATGNFPMGELDKTDEGEIAFGVTSHRGKVIIDFGKPVAWLGMDARQAASLAALLIRHANTCRDIAEEQKSQATAKEHAS